MVLDRYQRFWTATRNGASSVPLTPTTVPAADAELIDELLVEWAATDESKAVAAVALRQFARFMADRGGSLTTATQDDCVTWLRQRRGEVAASTVVKNWSQLKAFYRIAETDFADPLAGRRSPMTRIPMPRAPKYAKTHAATADEVAALMKTFDMRTGVGLRDAVIVSLMFRSGLRVGELAQIDLADVDLERRCVDLGITKNDEPRRPPLHPDTIAILRRYLRRRGEHPGALFVNIGTRRVSDRITTTAAQNVVKRAARQAGVKVTPHCLRRGFVVEYLAHGGDIATLMVIGGWASETMIYRYMGDMRASTAQTVFDQVASRQIASRPRSLRAVS